MSRPAVGATAPAPTFADPMKVLLKLTDDNLPPATVNPGSVEVTEGEVARIDRVVAGLRLELRRCHPLGVAADVASRGALRINVTIGPAGEVVHATAEGMGTVDDETTECVLRRVRSALFPRPIGSRAAVAFVVHFEPTPQESP